MADERKKKTLGFDEKLKLLKNDKKILIGEKERGGDRQGSKQKKKKKRLKKNSIKKKSS